MDPSDVREEALVRLFALEQVNDERNRLYVHQRAESIRLRACVDEMMGEVASLMQTWTRAQRAQGDREEALRRTARRREVDVRELQASNQAMKNEMDVGLMREIEDLREEVLALRETVRDLTGRKDDLEEENGDLRRGLQLESAEAAAQFMMQKLRAKVATLSSTRDELEGEAAGLRERLQQVLVEKTGMSRDLDHHIEEACELKNAALELTARADEALAQGTHLDANRLLLTASAEETADALLTIEAHEEEAFDMRALARRMRHTGDSIFSSLTASAAREVEVREECALLREAALGLKAALRAAVKENEELKDEVSACIDHARALEGTAEVAKAELAMAKSEEARLREIEEHLREDAQEHRERCEEMEKALDSKAQEARFHVATIAELKKKQRGREGELKKLKKDAAAAVSKMEKGSGAREAELHFQLEDAHAQITSSRKALEAAREELEAARGATADAKARTQKLEAAIARLNKEKKEAERQQRSLRKQAEKAAEKEAEALRRERDAAAEHVEELTAAKYQIAALKKAGKAAEKAHGAESRALQAKLRKAAKEHLAGEELEAKHKGMERLAQSLRSAEERLAKAEEERREAVAKGPAGGLHPPTAPSPASNDGGSLTTATEEEAARERSAAQLKDARRKSQSLEEQLRKTQSKYKSLQRLYDRKVDEVVEYMEQFVVLRAELESRYAEDVLVSSSGVPPASSEGVRIADDAPTSKSARAASANDVTEAGITRDDGPEEDERRVGQKWKSTECGAPPRKMARNTPADASRARSKRNRRLLGLDAGKAGGVARAASRDRQWSVPPAARSAVAIRKETPVPVDLTCLKVAPADTPTLGRVIAEGSYGVVYEGTWLGHRVAVKEYKEGFVSQQMSSRLFKEARLLKGLYCPGIPTLYGLFFVERKLRAVLEHAGPTTLFAFMHARRRQSHRAPELSVFHVLRVVYRLAGALMYLHEYAKAAHLDIKPDNIMYNILSDEVSLIDFGLSRPLREKGTRKATGRGNLWTCPTLSDTGQWSAASDVYSFGIIVCQLGALMRGVFPTSQDCVVDDPLATIAPVHKVLAEVADKCCAERPHKRMTMVEAMAALGPAYREVCQTESTSISAGAHNDEDGSGGTTPGSSPPAPRPRSSAVGTRGSGSSPRRSARRAP